VHFHPWRAIRAKRDITVQWTRLDGRLGHWCARTRTITLDPRQSQAERRCTATHELIHAELEHHGCQDEATELAVHKEAARRLIPLHPLGEALAWGAGHDDEDVADELWVDVDTLRTRLAHLHPAERGYLRARMARRDEDAA